MTFYFQRLVTVFFLLFFLTALAQDDVQVKISRKKIIIDGKYFYTHTVKKGETLIAISKAYNIPQKDIVMENPGAMQGLKPNTVLNIPVFEDRSKFIYHTVEKGQTLYFIAKKYQVDISILQKNNPAIENGLKVGMEIKIPLPDKNDNKTPDNKEPTDKKQKKNKEPVSQDDSKIVKDKGSQTVVSEETETYTVEKGQTIYSLSKMFRITAEQLKEANPELKERGLKVGEVLNIPSSRSAPVHKKSETDSHRKDSIAPEVKKDKQIAGPDKQDGTKNTLADSKNIEVVKAVAGDKNVPVPGGVFNTDCGNFDFKKYNRPFKIALLAPFYIAQNRGYVLKGKKKDEEPPVYPKSLKFIEFYQGLLLALDSLKKQGVSTELLVYDTERDSAKIASITKKTEFDDVDLIIGPFFSSNLRHFSDFAKSHKIPIVSPLSQNSEFLMNNPYAFQANPSNSTMVNEAADYFSGSKDINCLVVRSAKKEDSLLARQFKTKLFELYNVKFKSDPPHFKEMLYKEVGFKGVQESLSKEIDNVIFIPSVSETFVANVLNKLNTLETKFPIYILGMQTWAFEDNIEQDYLFNLQYTFFTSMYVDYKRADVIAFLNYYRGLFHAEPSKYSFQGFDIGMYFVNALKAYGSNFTGCILSDSKLNRKGLQTEFLFGKPETGNGFENTKSYIIQFDKEFNITNVNGENPVVKQDTIIPHPGQ